MPGSNIIDYVIEYGNSTFTEREFSTEDALVLCQFTYLKFEKLMAPMSENIVSVKELDASPLKESLFSDKWLQKENRALFKAMADSKRFENLKMCLHINRVEKDTQFAALTFLLPDNRVLVVFRGTDENLVGWQEDMGFALERPVTGQILSVKYINDVSERFGCRFRVAGHSKGGNLAIYASLMARKEARDRIDNIYSFDGPGFRKEFLEAKGYEDISDRVIKVIPKSSIVGMILDEGKDSMVVEARSLGFSQHNPYMWVIKNGKLCKTEQTEAHKKLVESVNEWILDKDENQLERFVKILNTLLDSPEANTTSEYMKDFLKNTTRVIKTAADIDEDTKKFISSFVKSYFEILMDMIKEEVAASPFFDRKS